ncbi:hypothetical protein [Agromyces allii]|uniref:Uncharacterized protein n=1 Tax=Agromyces allii TaxID=393607 RepID=A0ABN2QU99_9MICO|nr:hypothetical protein [Agromyces allii]
MGDLQRGIRVICVIGAIAAVSALTGCAPPAERRLHDRLAAQAAEVADEAGFVSQSSGLAQPSDALNEYARRIVLLLGDTGIEPQPRSGWNEGSPDQATPLRLVAIEPNEDAAWEDPVGGLVLASRLVLVSEQGSPVTEYCVRVEFDRWGFGERTAQAVDCPADPVVLTPPADPRPVIPEGAEQVVLEVLDGAGLDESAEQLAAEIDARLLAEPGGPPVAEPQVVREGSRIGFSMSDANDCLLIRAEGGVSEALAVPEVLLLPGEYGCRAETALLPDESFRSPH